MPTAYDYIARNKRLSLFLVVGFTAVVAGLGWIIGALTDFGPGGLVLASGLAIAMAVGGYYGGDRLALAVAGAHGPLTKDQQPYLYRLVENLSITAGLPMPKVYLINDPTINALATGRDPQHAAVAVTTGAIEKLANEELEGVLAHELSHVKNYDVRLMMLVLVLVNVVMLLSRWFFHAGSLGGRRSDNRSGNILAIVGIIFLVVSPIIAQLVQLAVARRRELLADASGALLTRFPEGLARALEKIGRLNLAPMRSANEATAHLFFDTPFGRKTSGLAKLFMTHPPIEERVAALRVMEG
jgi:heat shock protein HtpX